MGPAVGVGRGHAARSDGNEDATLSTRRSAQAGAGRAWIDRLRPRRKNANGKAYETSREVRKVTKG
jgi:hypothetical protein